MYNPIDVPVKASISLSVKNFYITLIPLILYPYFPFLSHLIFVYLIYVMLLKLTYACKLPEIFF